MLIRIGSKINILIRQVNFPAEIAGNPRPTSATARPAERATQRRGRRGQRASGGFEALPCPPARRHGARAGGGGGGADHVARN